MLLGCVLNLHFRKEKQNQFLMHGQVGIGIFHFLLCPQSCNCCDCCEMGILVFFQSYIKKVIILVVFILNKGFLSFPAVGVIRVSHGLHMNAIADFRALSYFLLYLVSKDFRQAQISEDKSNFRCLNALRRHTSFFTETRKSLR